MTYLLPYVVTMAVAQAQPMSDNYPQPEYSRGYSLGYSQKAAGGCGPKPRAWCGWWLNQQKGCVMGRDGNLARNWCSYGRLARPKPGAVVVWRRGTKGGHVGKIVNMVDECTAEVISGNDGGAVRTRQRNVCNAICVRV